MTEEATEIFTQILKDEGVPTTEEELKEVFYQELKTQGSAIANKSKSSPFFLILASVVTKPVLWLINFLTTTVMPNMFLKFAKGVFLEIIAWGYGITRKGATKAEGEITFFREGTSGDLPVLADVVIKSAEISGVTYQLITLGGIILDGQKSALIPVIAEKEGIAYNLQEGYYSILEEPVAGIIQINNESDWLSQPGADQETDDDLRERCRNKWMEQSGWHIDATYKSIISKFASISPNNIFFDHTAPRGAYTANANILLDVGEPNQEFLDSINYHINDEGYHGHNDDLLCFTIPGLDATVDILVTPVENLTIDQKDTLKTDVENIIQAAFRGNSAYEDVTRVKPFNQFSISNLGKEIHREAPNVYSLKWNSPTDDIITGMNIPKLTEPPTVVVA